MLQTMSVSSPPVSSPPVDRRLLTGGVVFLLAGLLGVLVLGWLTQPDAPARGLPVDLATNAVTACHVLGMALCTAACLPRGRATAFVASFSWASLHVLRELSEHPLLSAWLFAHAPDWLRPVWLIDEGGWYVLRGSFEPVELAVPLVAAVAAVVLILRRSSDR